MPAIAVLSAKTVPNLNRIMKLPLALIIAITSLATQPRAEDGVQYHYLIRDTTLILNDLSDATCMDAGKCVANGPFLVSVFYQFGVSSCSVRFREVLETTSPVSRKMTIDAFYGDDKTTYYEFWKEVNQTPVAPSELSYGYINLSDGTPLKSTYARSFQVEWISNGNPAREVDLPLDGCNDLMDDAMQKGYTKVRFALLDMQYWSLDFDKWKRPEIFANYNVESKQAYYMFSDNEIRPHVFVKNTGGSLDFWVNGATAKNIEAVNSNIYLWQLKSGDKVKVKAAPLSNYWFRCWLSEEGGDVCKSYDNPYEFEINKAKTSLYPDFRKLTNDLTMHSYITLNKDTVSSHLKRVELSEGESVYLNQIAYLDSSLKQKLATMHGKRMNVFGEYQLFSLRSGETEWMLYDCLSRTGRSQSCSPKTDVDPGVKVHIQKEILYDEWFAGHDSLMFRFFATIPDGSGNGIYGDTLVVKFNLPSRSSLNISATEGGNFKIASMKDGKINVVAEPDDETFVFMGWTTADDETNIVSLKDTLAYDYSTKPSIVARFAKRSVVSIDWTSPTDKVNLNDYTIDSETLVKIADGKSFFVNGVVYSGTLTAAQIAAIGGNDLLPISGVELLTSASGISASISESENMVVIPSDIAVNSVSFDRVFVSGIKSTVMFPFSVKVSDVVGGTFCKFVGVDKSSSEWTVQMETVSSSEVLEANTPYLLIPSAPSVTFANVTNLVANTDVVYSSTASNGWRFVGTYGFKDWNKGNAEIGTTYGFAAEDENDVSAGTFVKVAAGASISPMRAYLQYLVPMNRPSAKGEKTANVDLPESLVVVIVNGKAIGEEGTTVIGTINARTGVVTHFANNKWYSVDGRLLGTVKPTAKGSYYYNGKRVLVK